MDSDSDRILILSLAKAVFYICVTIALCFLFSTCTVDKGVIIQCEESCSDAGSKMKSVTARECECEIPVSIEAKSSPWVLP
jgi:hypothetical protein